MLTREQPVPKARTHFLMLINYCKEKIDKKLISLEKIASEENVADILTKPIFGADFQYKRQQLLGIKGSEPQLLPTRKRYI